jgi:hypothetical protein
MSTTVHRFSAWLHVRAVEARDRAMREADHGEVVEKVIIVAAAAAIAISAMAAIAAAVDLKIGGLQL